MVVLRSTSDIFSNRMVTKLVPLDHPERERVVKRYSGEEFYVIREVLQHKRVADLTHYLTMRHLKWTGDSNELLFLVRWKNYGPEDDTWEPLFNVFFTAPFLKYFREHLVPTLGRVISRKGEEEILYRFNEPYKRGKPYYFNQDEFLASFVSLGSIVKMSDKKKLIKQRKDAAKRRHPGRPVKIAKAFEPELEFDHDDKTLSYDTDFAHIQSNEVAKSKPLIKKRRCSSVTIRTQRLINENFIDNLNQDNFFGDAIEIDEELLRYENGVITTSEVLGDDEVEPKVSVCRCGRPRKNALPTSRVSKSQKQLEFKNLRALASRYQVRRVEELSDVIVNEETDCSTIESEVSIRSSYTAASTTLLTDPVVSSEFSNISDDHPAEVALFTEEQLGSSSPSQSKSQKSEPFPPSSLIANHLDKPAPLENVTTCHIYLVQTCATFQEFDQLVDDEGRCYLFFNQQLVVGVMGDTTDSFCISVLPLDLSFVRKPQVDLSAITETALDNETQVDSSGFTHLPLTSSIVSTEFDSTNVEFSSLDDYHKFSFDLSCQHDKSTVNNFDSFFDLNPFFDPVAEAEFANIVSGLNFSINDF